MARIVKRLEEVEQEQGQPLDVLIPALLQELGSQKAAADYLGISQASISQWLKANGYQSKTVWEKVSNDDQQPAA